MSGLHVSSPVAIRADLAKAHARAWERIGRPGTWWDGAARVAIAAETRLACSCGLCRRRKDALSPAAIEGAHDSLGELAEAVVTHSGGCEAAILITDLRGFTDLSGTLSPEALIALLAEYQSRLVPMIQHHGGSIDKYLGDGILASFGAVVPNPYYAADLCRALDTLAATARAWRLERQQKGLPAPNVGMAGAVGDVVFGTVGHESRLEYTVIGEVVNLVAKLEKHSKTEGAQALTTRTSYARALEQGYRPTRAVEERVGRSIEGVAHPVDLVVLAQ